ncbi:folylpolyglutamate synthase/dihydrofolate synthase family protein [Hyphobacterium sp. HN65]|uniref:Folylpolyglutamate synthase/dihydrofolate synthase family protein n=1 Tax=Hyphobacterium lacteum TaxID=3116575 RepID=A0ABU7LSR5_9PROT|nr:folylpolyglutamate synthase/dihydrofolate synthase family protein [Hyphobacterium sp. HN65]MEE2526941.1 folylpolyglutamate synthase/dihydrofolate synthase family protein [Hyphobacterium sp. HN65]
MPKTDGLQPVLDRLAALHPKKIDLSLGRLEALLEKLGNPHHRLPPVIHVAGTNGKGSVCASLRAMAEAAGERVHVYTSPHLVRFNERIVLAGDIVDDKRLTDAFARCEAVNDGAPITFFEITTAAAFLLFSETPADRLILEVGLGGRFDATNVIPAPAVTVITPVSLDHAEFLGSDIAGIAGEKAGIIKKGVPAIIGPQRPEAEDRIGAIANAIGAPLRQWGRDYRAWSEQGRLVYEEENLLWDLPRPALEGEHQIINAGIAVAAARAAGFGEPAVREGLEAVSWPARLQRLTSGPVVDAAGDAEVWLDGGHNEAAGQALARAMADLEARSPRPLMLICAFSPNKDARGYLDHFQGLARRVQAISFSGGRGGSQPPAEIVKAARKAGLTAEANTDLFSAIADATRDDLAPRILICGSLYLAGEVLGLNAGITPHATSG